MSKCVIYLRVSTEDQARQFSLPAQRKQLTQLAKSRGFRISGVYNEGGISGESLSFRPEMLRLLEDAESGEYTHVLITALDRISRNLSDSLYIRSKLQDAGITIVTPTQEFTHDSIDHDFTANLFGSMADYERKRILERCQQGRIEKKAKGGWLGGTPPKGYSYDKKEKKLVVDESEAEEVRIILDASIDGSPYFASKELGKQGIKITPRQIRRMTEKDKVLFYSGKTTDYSGKVIKAQWPQIIRPEMADKLLNAKRSRRTTGISTKATHLLTGLGIFKCRFCERTVKTFTGRRDKTGKRLKYYRCSASQYGETCKNTKGWRINVIDTVVISEIAKIMNNIMDIEQTFKQSMTNKQGNTAVKRLNKRLNDTRKKQNRLFSAVESGAIPMDDVSDRFQQLKKEESEIQSEIESFQANIKIPDFDALKLMAANFNFRTDFDHGQKRQIISLVFSRIELSKGSIYFDNLLKISPSEARIQLR